MQFDRAKLKTVVLYACSKCHPSQLGAVKLHKVLYFSDMVHFAVHGTPMVGATYRKRPNGPMADQLTPTLRELCQENSLEINESDYFGYFKKEYIAKKEPEIQRLNEYQRGLLDDVIDFVCFKNSAKTISEFSHNRAWEMTRPGAVIPYHTAFALFPSTVSDETIEWAISEAGEIATERPKRPSLDYEDFSSFRSRIQSAL